MYILLTIAYDGTSYCGWQRQKNGIAVQQIIEEALESLFKSPFSITGASRTDARVHALGQKAGFTTDKCVIPLSKLPQVLNTILPEDIKILCAEEKEKDFHPRFHAKVKTYEYRIQNTPYPWPQLRNFSYHIPYKLDFDSMQEASACFKGTHDFKAFCATGGSAKTTVRTIYQIELTKNENNIITLVLKGNGFLYNMVRIIAGTLAYVGQGKIAPGYIPAIIATGRRSLGGITAPPQGLTLLNVEY